MVLQQEIGRDSEFCSWYEYTGNVSLYQPGQIPPPSQAYSQHKLDSVVGGGA